MNAQVVSLPNLRIVDFGVGHCGSAHDSTAFKSTRIYLEHETLLKPGEFIWADSAYALSTWVTAPYKKPDKFDTDNEEFNNRLSIIRIRAEHAIGYLKGRFQLLKGLRILIKDKQSHLHARDWIASCIVIHAFAMMREAEERGDDDCDSDPFIADGLSSPSDSDNRPAGVAVCSSQRAGTGKHFRQDLKAKWFAYKEARAQRRRRNTGLSSEEDSD
ncbi:hypothetical protein PENSPDRAFT_694512 [Peniophora sp. CONT]|nr:hypothetical protein PENSPDRAFT_694512 [Peniophora sp. CONT]